MKGAEAGNAGWAEGWGPQRPNKRRSLSVGAESAATATFAGRASGRAGAHCEGGEKVEERGQSVGEFLIAPWRCGVGAHESARRCKSDSGRGFLALLALLGAGFDKFDAKTGHPRGVPPSPPLSPHQGHRGPAQGQPCPAHAPWPHFRLFALHPPTVSHAAANPKHTLIDSRAVLRTAAADWRDSPYWPHLAFWVCSRRSASPSHSTPKRCSFQLTKS